MQIKKIILYKNSNFIPRIISFEEGKVNIITGESKTGKTAIIDIVNYCLGSKNCNIKGRVIRNNVSWFAIIIKFNQDEIFVARQNPDILNQKTTSDIVFSFGKEVHIPKFEELIANSNITALNKFISNKLNFNTNLHKEENATRDDLEATFRHSRLFSFQPQNVIAEYKYLFFNQDESFVTQAIKDTLPYIIGAIREDELLVQQQITENKRKLNQLLREKKNEDLIKIEGSSKIYSLLEEAKDVGLIANNISKGNETDAINELHKLLKMDSILEEPTGENQQLSTLIDQRKELKIELGNLENEISAVSEFVSENINFSDEAKKQESRLMSIGLYKEPANNKYWHSIMGKEVDELPPIIEAINKSLLELKTNLNYTEKEKPRAQNYLLELKEKKNQLENDVKKVSMLINSIYKQRDEAESIRNINIRKGRILGRISLFLESINLNEPDSDINTQIKSLENKIDSLESLIGKEEKENKMNSILNKINILMTSWRDKLEFEYKNSNLRFDINKLTVFADSDEKTESLQQMGSGENWLACHLLIHFALHKHFIDKKRPVPNFLILDQPTQVHYPKNYQELAEKKTKSSDEVADEKMFKFIFEITNQLFPKLQVIVTDHANLGFKDFQDSIIEEWRNGNKLIPKNWIE